MPDFMRKQRHSRHVGHDLFLAGVAAATVCGVFGFAPSERTMGDVQKIVYIHVPVAWFSLLALAIMAAAGLGYLVRRDLRWDAWAAAAGETGWLCCSLTLATGSLWAHEAWGAWWTWDPRLTTVLVLWLIYSSWLILRGSIEDPHRRARAAAVLSVVGLLDLPLVVMATRWFRGIHPTSPEMEPAMRGVLLSMVVVITAVMGDLVVRRARQIQLAQRLAELESKLASETAA